VSAKQEVRAAAPKIELSRVTSYFIGAPSSGVPLVSRIRNARQAALSGVLSGCPLLLKGHDLISSERVQSIRAARFVHELDLERFGGENFDDSANLSGDKTQFGQIADQGDGVEQLDVRRGRHGESSIS
jgi:hypothetical protein